MQCCLPGVALQVVVYRKYFLYNVSMKFKTQHRKFKTTDHRGREDHLTAHRDGKLVWATRPSDKASVVIMSRKCETVREAKAWMNMPTIY